MMFDIIVWSIPTIFVVWVAFVFYANRNLPKIEVKQLAGKNGYNTPFKAIVDPTTRYPVAVLCQEVFEARWKIHPTRMLLHRTAKQTRERELRGHEIEVQAARMLNLYDNTDTESKHRRREASALKHHYKGFDNLSTEDIYREMLKHKHMAIAWVRQHGGRIKTEYSNATNR